MYSPPDMMDTSSSFPRLYMCVCMSVGGKGGGGELSNIDKLMKLLIHSLLCTCMYICSENNILSNIAMRVRANY